MGAYISNPMVWYLGRWERTLDLHFQEKVAAAADREEISHILTLATATYSPLPSELNDRARERLESCAFVGLVERMDESLAKLSKVLGGPPLVNAPVLEGWGDECTLADLPPSLIEKIEGFAFWDLPLYEEFARRFDDI